MITLHESNITSMPLDNGIGVLSDAITAPAEEELNGMFEFTMEYPSDGYLVKEIKEERIIKAKAQDKLGYQLFRIYSIIKNHDNDNLTINAQHITYDLGNNFIEALNASGLTKQQVMQLIGASTVEQHTFNITSPNNSTRSSTKLFRTNPLQMIAGMEGSVLQIWGGQIERDNFNLILHDRRGHDDGVTITYEKNITGLEATFDISGLITRIFPFVLIEATDDSPERLITVNGNYIDSEHINDYEQIFIEPIDYTHNDKMDLQDKTDAEIRTQLTNLANSYFEEMDNDKPKVTLNVNFAHLWETEEYKNVAPLELVGMGDTVTVNHSRLGIEATAIVNRIVYDSIAEVNTEVGIGNVKARLSDTVNKIDNIINKVDQAQSSANHAITAANGKNTIFYGPDEPTSGMILNDTWFEQVDNQFVRTWRFDGIQWQAMIDMDSYEAKQEAQQAKDRANEAYDNAGIANDNAMTAIGNAQSAFDKAQESLSGLTTLAGFVDDNTGEITTIKGSVEGLQTTVQGKVDNDTFTTFVQQTNNSLAGKISMTDAEGVFVKGTTFSATIDGLQTTVQNKADKSTVTQLAGVVDTKISTTDANNKFATQSQLTQTASSLTSTITSVRNDLDGLEIGGRNLVLNSKEVVLVPRDTGASADNFNYAKMKATETLEKGQNYTISFTVEITHGNFNLMTILYFQNGVSLNRVNAPIRNGRVIHTFAPNNTADEVLIYAGLSGGTRGNGVVLKNIQVEKGNVATDWSPAPEDMATQSQFSQLSNAINLRVTKADLINQINIDTTGILISGKKLILDGDTTVNGTFKLDGAAHILDATIGTAQIAEISASKLASGEINTNLITIHGGTTTEYAQINGSEITTRGTHTRTWFGETKTHDVGLQLRYGRLRFHNYDSGRNLYFSDFGISTYYGGSDGEDGGNQGSGTIEFFSYRHNSAIRGLTMYSNNGIVALESEQRNIVIAPRYSTYSSGSKFDFDVKSTGDGYITFGDTGIRFSTGSVSGDPLVHATNGNGDLASGSFYAQSIFADLKARGTYAYVRAPRLRIIDHDTNSTTYGDIQTAMMQAYTLRVNQGGSRTFNNFFIGVSSGELRVTDNATIANETFSSANYRPVRASVYHATSKDIDLATGRLWNDGSSTFVQGSEVRASRYKSSTLVPMYASAFNQGSSRDYKTNIVPFTGSALDVINGLEVVNYNLIDELEHGINDTKIGFISEDSEPIATRDLKAIESYKLSTYNTKAIQELDLKINLTREELILKIAELEERINDMESAA